MCKGILSVATINTKVSGSSEGKEQSLDRLFNTGRVSLDSCTEAWGSTDGSITAMAGTMVTIGLDAIVLMRSEYNRSRGTGARCAVHARDLLCSRISRKKSDLTVLH